MRRLVFALWALCGPGLSGCTFFNEGNPLVTVTLSKPDGLPTSEVGDGRRVGLTVPFADLRPSRNYCGDQKITYGFSRGLVACAGSPAADLALLLEERLRSSGFSVVSGTPPVVAGGVRIDGELLQFHIERVRHPNEVETDVHVRLRATSPLGLEAEREFYEKGRGGDYQRSVNSALRKILPALSDAIAELLDEHPKLAPAASPIAE